MGLAQNSLLNLQRVGNTLVDPILQIKLRRGRFDLDDGGSQQFICDHEPEIAPDKLWMRLCDDPWFVEPLVRRDDVDYEKLVPFSSKSRTKLLEFSVYYQSADKESAAFRLSLPRELSAHRQFVEARFPLTLAPGDLESLTRQLVEAALEILHPEGAFGQAKALNLYATVSDASWLGIMPLTSDDNWALIKSSPNVLTQTQQ